MTLRFTDGFDSYAATADLLKKWQVNGGATWSSSVGRNGGGGLQFTVAQGLISYPVAYGGTISNFAWWYKATAKPGATSDILVGLTANTTGTGRFSITTGGFLQLRTSGSVALITGNTNICDGNWHWIDTLNNWQNGAATTTVYIDGVLQWNSSQNTAGGTTAMIELVGFASGTQTWDDLISYDNTGSSPINSDFPIGPQQINTLRPNGDSAIQFSPDTGATNYTQVNEVNGDTTHYVQDGTSGHQDLYNYDDLSFSPAKIWGVMANAYANNPGIGSINHNQLCKNNTTTTTGTTTQTPITNARVVQEPFVLDPNTGSAWASSTAINSALFGIKVT